MHTHQHHQRDQNNREQRQDHARAAGHPQEAPRLLDEATVHDVINRIKQICRPEGSLQVVVRSVWWSEQRWARNRAAMTSDKRDIQISISQARRGVFSSTNLNQLDTASLQSAVDWANAYIDVHRGNTPPQPNSLPPHYPGKGRSVWSDQTFNRTAQDNGRVVHALVQRSEAEGLLSAGTIRTFGANAWKFTRSWPGQESMEYGRATEIQGSVTVRYPKGTGSGWAGNSAFDLPRIDMAKIADLAFEKCMKSLDPVRIEPGRYQTILEPQAVAELAGPLFSTLMSRDVNEHARRAPLYLGYDKALDISRSKLGLRIIDARLSLYHDPEDPLSGTHPEAEMEEATFIKDGVLTAMAGNWAYARQALYQPTYVAGRSSMVMSGGNMSIEEMIATMTRGLLVTRFSDLQLIDGPSLLCSGFTRDGLWLIEKGKITKAVRNFRLTESPLFAFNNVVDLGVPTPVFSPNTRGRFPVIPGGFQNAVTSIVVPPMKVNDFSFTQTIDAI